MPGSVFRAFGSGCERKVGFCVGVRVGIIGYKEQWLLEFFLCGWVSMGRDPKLGLKITIGPRFRVAGSRDAVIKTLIQLDMLLGVGRGVAHLVAHRSRGLGRRKLSRGQRRAESEVALGVAKQVWRPMTVHVHHPWGSKFRSQVALRV